MLVCQGQLQNLGYYRIILFTFYVEVGMAIIMLALGPHHYYIMAFFLTANMYVAFNQNLAFPVLSCFPLQRIAHIVSMFSAGLSFKQPSVFLACPWLTSLTLTCRSTNGGKNKISKLLCRCTLFSFVFSFYKKHPLILIVLCRLPEELSGNYGTRVGKLVWIENV